MKHLFLTLLCGAVFITAKAQQQKKAPKGAFGVEIVDPEMQAATEKAQSTLDQAMKALRDGQYDKESYSLKVRFPITQDEHISAPAERLWVVDIVEKDGKLFGTIGENPRVATQLKYGDTVVVEQPRIVDWMYGDKGKLCGGHVFRLELERAGEAAKKEALAYIGLRIED